MDAPNQPRQSVCHSNSRHRKMFNTFIYHYYHCDKRRSYSERGLGFHEIGRLCTGCALGVHWTKLPIGGARVAAASPLSTPSSSRHSCSLSSTIIVSYKCNQIQTVNRHKYIQTKIQATYKVHYLPASSDSDLMMTVAFERMCCLFDRV